MLGLFFRNTRPSRTQRRTRQHHGNDNRFLNQRCTSLKFIVPASGAASAPWFLRIAHTPKLYRIHPPQMNRPCHARPSSMFVAGTSRLTPAARLVVDKWRDLASVREMGNLRSKRGTRNPPFGTFGRINLKVFDFRSGTCEVEFSVRTCCRHFVAMIPPLRIPFVFYEHLQRRGPSRGA